MRYRIGEADAETRDEEEDSVGWFQIASPLIDRATALGGRVVAYGSDCLAIDFAWDGLYDAIDFVVDSPVAVELRVGMATGDAQVVYESSRVAFLAGPVLIEAEQISRSARPSEVLVSPGLVAMSDGRIGVLGEAQARSGRPRVPAFVLDPLQPLREPPPLLEMPELDEAPAVDPNGPSSLRASAMADLAQGRSGDAIRRLRDAKQDALRGDGQDACRASLALSVALFKATRPFEALLEALEALAFSRERSDDRGEEMVSRFIAQLAEALGHSDAAHAWNQLASDPA